MFAPIWQAYRDHLIFAAALAAYACVAGLCLVASATWAGLLAAPFAGAAAFLLVPTLRRFLPVFAMLALGALALLAGGELLFRARYFGTDAIRAFRDYSPLPVTALPGFTTPSDDPELGYLFTPHASARVNGKTWQINDDGFRDGPFAQDKAPGVFRVLVLGDSFVLGAGVALEERFSSQLASLLAGPGDPPVEVYNLGIAGVSLRELAHVIETRGTRYRADLILVGLRASQLHEAAVNGAPAGDAAQAARPRAANFSFPRRYAFTLNVVREPVEAGLRRVMALLPGARPSRNGSTPRDGDERPIEEFLRRSAAYAAQEQVPVVVVALRKMEFASDLGLRAKLAERALEGDASRRKDHEELKRLAAQAGVAFVDTYQAFGSDVKRSDYIVYPGDGHPNASGHRRYAETIVSWLRANGYPPRRAAGS